MSATQRLSVKRLASLVGVDAPRSNTTYDRNTADRMQVLAECGVRPPEVTYRTIERGLQEEQCPDLRTLSDTVRRT